MGLPLFHFSISSSISRAGMKIMVMPSGKRAAIFFSASSFSSSSSALFQVAKNETTAEEWANRYNKVGVLVELAKVKELSADIMSGSIWSSVQREQMLAMGEKICSQQAKLISLLEKSSLGADSA